MADAPMYGVMANGHFLRQPPVISTYLLAGMSEGGVRD
jgi:hypothetical protein